jgi:hypothetical protein
MGRRLAVLLPIAVTLWALAPAAAIAQSPSNPLSPGLPALPTPTTTTPTATTPTTTTTTSSGGSVSGKEAIAIAACAVVLLTAISFFIWRDARRRAPSRGGRAMTAADGPTVRGTKPRPKPRKPSPAERRRRKRGRAR